MERDQVSESAARVVSSIDTGYSDSAAQGRDWTLLRRYFSPRNEDGYRADLRTLAPIPGSLQRRVTRGQAKDALDRLEAKYGR